MLHDYLTSRAFQSLTLRDLLEARDRHHVRLATQYTNVVGTAVGFFRYRTYDEAYRRRSAADQHVRAFRPDPDDETIARKHSPRRMEDSAVRPWSPPCVLVFVDRWLTPDEFRTMPALVIPSFLETDDARLVPTCVVLAEPDQAAPDPSTHLNFPAHLYGGGFIVTTEVQGKKHLGSVACLVTDGDLTYALTNRHVTGTQAGRPIYTYVGEERVQVGVSDALNVGKVPSAKAYPKWPGQEAYANVDAGLIRVDDVREWTTQVFGLGHLEEPFRINFDAALETCIGLPVRAFGGASGPLQGEIMGLFYRYKALAGYDFIADFLIGPRPVEPPRDAAELEGSATAPPGPEDGMQTLPGDSGTLWVVDRPEQTRAGRRHRVAPWWQPIAVQWGGQVMLGAGGRRKFHFALATSLESVCRLLDVDVVRDWNLGHPEYWGEMGHYAIGLKACSLVSDLSPKLRELLTLNSRHIGFEDAILRDPDQYHKRKAGYRDVPLADVPDNVWRLPSEYGGRSGRPEDPTKNNDSNNHFADMDQPGVGTYAGKSLMDLYREDPASLNIDTWNEFYTLLQESGDPVRPGAVPFRIWQAYDAMVDSLKAGDVLGYLCVAGTVAHYVGDACQPLHISRLHHGNPGGGSVARDVHEVYETAMLDAHAGEVVDGLNERLDRPEAVATPTMDSGGAAARGVVELMLATFDRLPPERIVETYNGGHNREDRTERLWSSYREETLDNMAACCTFLASLWESAWRKADGENQVPAGSIKEFDYQEEIRPKYRPQSFFPSVALADMKPYCK